MKNAKWVFLIAFFLSSCAPTGQNITKQENNANISVEKSPVFSAFNKVMSLPDDIVAITKDIEGKVWVIKRDSVFVVEKGKLKKCELNGHYRGNAVNAYGTTRGFYVFYGKESEDRVDPSYGNSKKIANSVKYYNGNRYIEVFRGEADPFNNFVDSKGRLWICEKDRKIAIIDGLNKVEFSYNTKVRRQLQGNYGSQAKLPLQFYEDTKGRVWICSEYRKFNNQIEMQALDGFLCFDNNEIYSFPLEAKANDPAVGILELPSGELLISFNKGGSWLFEYTRLPDNTVSLSPKGTSLAALKDHVISRALHTKDGRIIVIARDKIGRSSYNIFNSIFLISSGQAVLLKKNIEAVSSWGPENDFAFEMCEDPTGAVWMNGEHFLSMKVLKDGSVKEYKWTDGIFCDRAKKLLSDGNNVYLFVIPENRVNDPMEWYVYDSSMAEECYKNRWETFNSLCVPLLDSKKNLYYVDENDGWLKKYDPDEKKLVCNALKQVKKIGEVDRFGSPALLGICEGVEDDIWLFIGSIDIWVVKYKDGAVKETKLKDALEELAKEKSWKKLNIGAMLPVKAVFSSDGYIAMADYHFNRRVYFFDKVFWQALESKDINGENGFEVSDPLKYEGDSIAVNLRDKNNRQEKSYIFKEGKWLPLKEKLEVKYSLDNSGDKRTNFTDEEKTLFEFSDGNISVRDLERRKAAIPVKKPLNFQDRFTAGGFLWLVLRAQPWNEKTGSIGNNVIYPVYKCAYKQFFSSVPVPVYSSNAEKETQNEKITLEMFPDTLVKIDSEETAYRFLAGGSVSERRAAERYFISAGEKGKAYLAKMLEKEKDERMLWTIKALLSR